MRSDRARYGLRWPRPRGSFGPVRAHAPWPSCEGRAPRAPGLKAPVGPAMLSVASTRTRPKSSNAPARARIITAPGEKCGLAKVSGSSDLTGRAAAVRARGVPRETAGTPGCRRWRPVCATGGAGPGTRRKEAPAAAPDGPGTILAIRPRILRQYAPSGCCYLPVADGDRNGAPRGADGGSREHHNDRAEGFDDDRTLTANGTGRTGTRRDARGAGHEALGRGAAKTRREDAPEEEGQP